MKPPQYLRRDGSRGRATIGFSLHSHLFIFEEKKLRQILKTNPDRGWRGVQIGSSRLRNGKFIFPGVKVEFPILFFWGEIFTKRGVRYSEKIPEFTGFSCSISCACCLLNWKKGAWISSNFIYFVVGNSWFGFCLLFWCCPLLIILFCIFPYPHHHQVISTLNILVFDFPVPLNRVCLRTCFCTFK